METVYAIVHRTHKECYVGRTSRPLMDRWAEHLSDAANPLYRKNLAEALRHDPEGFDILKCDVDGKSEAYWYQTFVDDGYVMLNEAPTAKTKPKARDKAAEKHWRSLSAGPEVTTDLKGESPNEYFLRNIRERMAARGEPSFEERYERMRKTVTA